MNKKLLSMIKKALCCGMALSMAAGSVLPAKAAENASLIAKYDFETVSGTTVPNVAEGAAGFTGMLKGSNVSIEAGTELGNSLKFTDGTEGHMLVENIVNTGTTSYSMAMWYKYDTTANRNNKNAVLLQQGGGGRTLLTLTPANKYHTYVNTADKYSTGTVDVEKWQHVILVNDAANQKVKFYINGKLDSEQAAGSGSVNALTSLLIGRHKNGGTDPQSMRGLVDEICIYEGILTDAEAMSLYEEKADLVNIPEETPEEQETITINVDPTAVERELDRAVFGINHRYAFNGYGTFDSYLMEMKDDFQELYEEAGFGSIRYPGGTISNLFNWKTTLDSVGRKNQIHGFYNNAGQGGIEPNFGIKEIADFADEVDSEIVYVYSLGRGNVQDAEDLIEFLNAEVGTNPNGGIDWAAVRAENGHPKPYNVRYFEIGNEMQQVYADGTSSQGYWLHGVSNAEAGYIEGGIATFTKQYAVCEEDWNAQASKSDGSANMVRYMRYANTNPKKYDADGKIIDDPDYAAIEKDGVAVFVGSEQWTIVGSLEQSAATDKHVVIDYSTGGIHFGDGVKGAIPAAGQQIYVTYQVKRDGFVQISKAMKDTTAAINEANEKNEVDARHEAYVYSSYETNGFITRMANGGYNDLYDGLTIHPYSGTPSGSGTAFYDSAMSLAESVGVKKVQEYVNMMPEGKVPVISEYGIFRSTDPLLRSQTHAIYIAKVLMEYVRLGSPYIQKHCLTDWYSSGADSLGPTQQAVIQVVAQNGANTAKGEGDFAFFSTPSARVFQMLNKSFGDEVLASSFSVDEKLSNGVAAYSALASKDAYDNYYAAVVNVDRQNAKRMELKVDGVDFTGKTVEIQLLASETYADENTLENPDNVKVKTTTFVNEGAAVTFEIPKHSVMVVKVSAGVDKTALEEALNDAKDLEEADYTTDSWRAANVAAAMEAAQTVWNNSSATEAEVADAVSNLQAAMDSLVFKTADKTALNKKIAEADALDAEEYTGASWSEMQQILSSAKIVAEKENASEELVGKVLADLTAALDALKKIIPLSAMNVTAGDSNSASEGPSSVTDNQTGTIWHTNWYGTTRENHYLQFELTEEYVVDGLCYLPRQSGSNGDITGYQILVSDDGEHWEKAAEGTWSTNKEWKFTEFEGQKVQYVRLVAVNTVSDSQYVFASAAEVRLTGEKYEEPVIPSVDVTTVFSDVKAGEWYVDAVQYVYDQGIIVGDGNVFAPNDATTRAMVAVILYRLAGSPEMTEADYAEYNKFEDLPKEHVWYSDAVAWALKEKVSTGDDVNMKYNPTSAVTREQLALFLWRYAKYTGKDTSVDATYEELFGETYVNDWAKEGFAWAVDNGIIKGAEVAGPNGTVSFDLNPQGGATRAQLATMLKRYLENVTE